MSDKATLQQTATAIADRLGESEAGPRSLIIRIVKELGAEPSLAVLHETLQIEANGGMLLPSGSRRRTPGGVFFFLVREQLNQSERKDLLAKIFIRQRRPARRRKRSKQASTTPVATWAERGAWLAVLGEANGEAKTVKVTVRHITQHGIPIPDGKDLKENS